MESSMYHEFQVSTADGRGGDGKLSKERRVTTTNACLECRRRKIRCDGKIPCSQCEWYHQAHLCAYVKHPPRVVPSKRVVTELQAQNDQLAAVFNRLFPGQDPERLTRLSRSELVDLASNGGAQSNPQLPWTARSTPEHISRRQTSEGAESLAELEQAPEEQPIVDESRRHGDSIQAISDDINALSLSIDHTSSYVGISSITAALKVIFRVAPAARQLVSQSYNDSALEARPNNPSPGYDLADADPYFLPPANVGLALLNSYFYRIHPIMPMIDENKLWLTYSYGTRSDSPWLALLNTVFALGSLASSTHDDKDHIAYYQRARHHVDTATFGSASLLALQALGLLSGYYLHWLNRPNEANNLMGATLRMATALGLHREYGEESSMQPRPEVPVEIRRRTWWSIFCLDNWAMLSTGRPSLGRNGPGITVRNPSIPQQMDTSQQWECEKLLPIVYNAEFCKLCTRIVDKLAEQPLLDVEELESLDQELVLWRNSLPPVLRDIVDTSSSQSPAEASAPRTSRSKQKAKGSSPVDFSKPPSPPAPTYTECPDILKTPRAIMYWWYLNIRMIIHRPYVLSAALRRTPIHRLSPEPRSAILKCRNVAAQTIHDISATCEPNLIAGWNAVWIMYQAVMVPLVSLFSHLSLNSTSPNNAMNPGPNNDRQPRDDNATVANWNHQIETALAFFTRMHEEKFSVAASKSHDVVRRLYDATKTLASPDPNYGPAVGPLCDPPDASDIQLYAPDQTLAQHHQQQQQQQQQHQHQQVPWSPTAMNDTLLPFLQFPDTHFAGGDEAAIAFWWDDINWDSYPEMDMLG